MALAQVQSLDGAHEVNPGRLEIDGARPSIELGASVGVGDIGVFALESVQTTTERGYTSRGVNFLPRTGVGVLVGEIRRAIHAGHDVTAGGSRSEGGTEFRAIGPIVIGSGKGLSVGRFGLKKTLDI
jgi:hypothetical protein